MVANTLKTGGNGLDIFYSIAFIFSVFFCVILHELGHALTAKQFNYLTKDIILLPVGGMARMEELPENPKQELWIAAVGPLVNISIAFILYLFIYAFDQLPTPQDLIFHSGNAFLFNLFIANISLAIFNLIPAFPMDGGRILRAILSFNNSRVKATITAARIGQIISIIFFFAGLFFTPFLMVVGIVIFIMAQTEADDVKSTSILQDYKVKDIIMHKFHQLEASDTISDAVKLLLDVQATDFIVTKNELVVGTLNRNGIIKVLSEKGKETQIHLVMNPITTKLSLEQPLDQLFKKRNADNSHIIPVIDNEKLIGIVDVNNILELIMIREASNDNYSSLFSLNNKKDKTVFV